MNTKKKIEREKQNNFSVRLRSKNAYDVTNKKEILKTLPKQKQK